MITDNEAINERERDALKTYSFLVEGHKLETNVRKIVLKDRAIMQTKAEALQLIKQNSVEEVKEVVKEDKKN